MVTGTGLVKILDFGIAKLTGPTPAAGSTDETLPIDSPMTVEGSILGTVCYMSPEQAQAKAVDPRSDIFSFGLVLYEMLTGQKAFSGDSALHTLSAILRDEAKPIHDVVEGVPPELEQIVHRAMRKAPDERWQTTADMRAALMVLKQKADSGILQTMVGGAAAAGAKKSSRLASILAAAAIVVLAAGGGGAWWWMKHRQAQQNPPVAVVTPPPVPVTPAPVVETPAPAPVDEGMTNKDVLGLVEAKVAPQTIMNQIRSAPTTSFDMSTAAIIELSKGGVPSSIIELMRNPKAPVASSPATAAPTRPTTTTVGLPPKSTTPAPVEPTPAPATAPVTPPPAPVQPAPVVAAPTTPIRINTVAVSDGKPFNITLAQDIPVKLSAGQKISFTITNDVKVGDIVVIAKGTPVVGEVVDPGDAKKVLGILGSRKATFKLTGVESAGGGRLNIRGTPAHSDKPDRPIELPGNRPKDVLARSGAEYMGYVDSDQTVTIRH
jgi:serine/threonine-protein kinase